jgi:O-antigen/teichoic acid export membrane protein
MKALARNMYANPRYTKIFEWGKLVSITGSAQLVVQGVGFISGILIIRMLPTQEYAMYTLANTMLGTMMVLADGGIASGVMAQGGKVWKNPEKLGVVLSTGLDLRRKFAITSLILSSPVLFILLRHHGASWPIAITLLISLIPAFLTALSGTLLEVIPKLHQDIVPLQKIQMANNIGRLALLSVIIFFFPLAYLAILAAGLPQIWANFRLRKLSHKYSVPHNKPDAEISKKILAFVKRILPGSIYYCLSGQITIWLISIVGTTKSVAQVGALGRLAMLLGLFTTLFNTLIIPRYSRLPHDRELLIKRYLQIMLVLISLSFCIVSIVYLFPAPLLWLLGKEYADLKLELVLNIAGSCLAMIVGCSFSICSSRGWAMNPLIPIITSLVAITLGVFLIDISTLKGILLLNIFIAVAELALYLFYNISQIIKEPVTNPNG